MRASWEALHAGLDRSIRTLQAEQAFQQLKHRHSALAGYDEPRQLVAHLTSKAGDLDEKDRVLGTLVGLVQRREQPELASSLLWLGLWPGLDAVYRRRYRRLREQREEFVPELSVTFSMLVARLDLRTVNRVAASLVRGTERDLIESLRRREADANRLPGADPDAPILRLDGRIEVASPLDHAARQHWEACDPGLPCVSFDEDVESLRLWLEPVVGADAELLLAVVVLDETQREAAERLGLSHEAARKRFQRALTRIRDRVGDPVSRTPLADCVCTHTSRPLHP